jgi:hypothetical protein
MVFRFYNANLEKNTKKKFLLDVNTPRGKKKWRDLRVVGSRRVM